MTNEPHYAGPVRFANRLFILLLLTAWPTLVIHGIGQDGLTWSNVGLVLFSLAYAPVLTLWNSIEFLALQGRGLIWYRSFLATAVLCFLTSIVVRAWQH